VALIGPEFRLYILPPPIFPVIGVSPARPTTTLSASLALAYLDPLETTR